MGFLDLQNTGGGTIPSGDELGSSWNISYNTSPYTVGQGSGNLGSLTFSSKCDDTTIFTIDNYLSVRHFFDNRTARWLSTFDVNVTSVDTDGEFANFTTTSRIAELDVVRTSSSNPSGLLQREFEFPKAQTYVANSVTYNALTNPTVYDVASSPNYVYVLAQGSHGGEVVYRFGLDGYFYSMYAVYSDATDLSNPQSRYLTYVLNTAEIQVAQVGASRIKRFTAETGAFTGQYGAAGTGNGQFNTISGIASRGSDVFVIDSVLGRVQRFNGTGVYQLQWGTQGTTDDRYIFNQPNAIAIPQTGSYCVYVSDMFARVREYTSDGVFVCQPVGTYDFSTSTSRTWLVPDARIGIGFDATPSMYIRQNGTVEKYVGRSVAGFAEATNFKYGAVLNASWDSGVGSTISGGRSGVLHVVDGGVSVAQYAGGLNTLQAYYLYYIGLAAVNFPVRLLTMADTKTSRNNIPDFTTSGYPSWEMSVWSALCELSAATGNSVLAFDNFVSIQKRDDSKVTLRIPDDITPSPIRVNSRASTRKIVVSNLNAVRGALGWTAKLNALGGVDVAATSVMYSAAADGGRTFSADVGSIDYVTVAQGSFPEVLLDPVPISNPVNPFPNPGAETDLSYFASYVPSGVATLARDTTVFHTGAASARLTFTTAPTTIDGYISQQVTVAQGRNYDFRAFARCTGANQQVYLVVDWRNSANVHVGFTLGAATTITSSGWSEVRIVNPQVPPPGASYAWVRVQTHPTGRLWLNGQALYVDTFSNGAWDATSPNAPTPGPGEYIVYDSNNVLVDAQAWTNYGGSVRASLGDKPGDILLTVSGPSIQVPGTQRPYRISTLSGQAALSVVGGGIITNTEQYEIGTGVPESAARSNYTAIDSFAIVNAGTAYTEAGWLANSQSPQQTVSFSMRINKTPAWASGLSGQGGTVMLTNVLTRHKNALYIVDSVSANNSTITLNCTRHTPWLTDDIASIEYGPGGIWSGKPASEFAAYWGSRPAQDFCMAPLENPFGA